MSYKQLIGLVAGVVCTALATILVAQDRFLPGGAFPLFPCNSFSGTYTAGAWTNSNRMNLQGFNTLSVRAKVTSSSAPASGLLPIELRYQWNDSTNENSWVTETVLSEGTATSTDQPYTALNRIIRFNATNDVGYVERCNRLAQFFRVGLRTDQATNATVVIYVTPFGN